MSILGATILTARATVWLAILAAITAAFAFGAFTVQYRQLKDQIEERKRERLERRSAQAVQVYIWETHFQHAELYQPLRDKVTVHVRNTSQQPVFDLRFEWQSGGATLTEILRAAPLLPDPGENQDADTATVPDGTDPKIFGAVVTFRDRAGVRWVTRPDGRFEELPSPGAAVAAPARRALWPIPDR